MPTPIIPFNEKLLPVITEKRIQLDSNWFSPEKDVKRSKGLHLSQVIDFIEAREREEGRNDALHNWAVGGFLWERLIYNMIERNPFEMWDWMFSRALNEVENPKVVRPGEQEMNCGPCPVCQGMRVSHKSICKACNGTGILLIFMTPDGYHIDDMCLEEYKATSKSSKNPITGPKFRRWISYQIPAYLKALGLTKCRLRVYFSRGNYTTNEPEWWEFYLVYTQQEIDETWDSVVINAQTMLELGVANFDRT